MIEKDLKQISQTEKINIDVIEKEILENRAAVLKNKKKNIKPVIIGRKFKCKYNLNLGLSSEKEDIKQEIKKIEIAHKFEADTVMDFLLVKNEIKQEENY